jgi:hypothetical protein
MKNVNATTGSGLVLLRASNKMLGDIKRRKLTLQRSQSTVGPSTNGLSFIHHPNGRTSQRSPVRPPRDTRPRKTTTPAANRGTYRNRFGGSIDIS